MWKSFGLIRGIGFTLTFFGHYIAPAIPVTAPFSQGFVELGILISGAGVANAAINTTQK